MKLGDDSETFSVYFDLALDWRSVNPEFDQSAFSLERLDRPAGTHLISDARIDPTKPVIIQHPGSTKAELERILKANESAP